MTVDLIRLSAAIDAALPLLDAVGRDEHAHTLRTQSPALFRLARIGQAAHDAEGREPSPDPSKVETEALSRKPPITNR